LRFSKKPSPGRVKVFPVGKIGEKAVCRSVFIYFFVFIFV